MSTNPFLSLERLNFPEFSPMFKKKTPSSTEKNSSFRWSIDQIARLKPADIDIDPATLVKTNGHSPAVDSDAEKASENFFSQKTILPSPWPAAPVAPAKVGGGHGTFLCKKVTFSPLPPATAFIREESLVESEVRDNGKTDAGTQTVMTFPINFDLLKLLGPGFNYLEEKAACDLGNSSLRRKLFGQPDRQGSTSLSSSLSSEGDEIQLDPSPPRNTPFTPSKDHLKTPVTKKTVRHPSSSSTPSNRLLLSSPAIVFKNTKNDSAITDPAHSSMVAGVLGGLLPDISPITYNETGCATEGEGEDEQPPVRAAERTESGNSDGCLTMGVVETRKVLTRQQLFPPTPIKDVHMESLSSLSPICGLEPGSGISPPPPTLQQEVQFDNNAVTPAAIQKVKVHSASGKTTCTSTPNTAALKRQLVASPFASPVLKQPCTRRLDILEEEEVEADPAPLPSRQRPRSPHHGIINDQSDSELSIPQPLSLADLQTETYELTSVTPTTCTSFFAQFGLEDRDDNEMTLNGPHPLHSTAASHMTSNSTHWNPPIHSTMVDSHCKLPTSPKAFNGALPQVSLPLVGGLSKIHPHLISSLSSVSNLTGGCASQPSVPADSGVIAYSGDFNLTAVGGNAKMTSGPLTKGESGISVSTSDPSLKMAERKEEDGGEVSKGERERHFVTGEYERQREAVLAVKPDPPGGCMAGSSDEINLKEGDTRGERDVHVGFSVKDVVHCHHRSEFDSGLVPSPLHDLERSDQALPNVPKSDRLRPPSPLATGASVVDSLEKRRQAFLHALHDKTPSRLSNLQSGVGLTLPMSPVNVHHFGGAPGQINHGLGSHYPAFSSRLSSKCPTLSSGTYLPSRLKLSSENAGLKSPYSCLSHCNHGNSGSHVTLSRDVFEVGGVSRTTPTRRFSNKGTGGKSSLSGLTRDVVRKKESLKARLQFSSPIDSPVSVGATCSVLQSPLSSRTAAGRPRVPLTESSFNRPRSPQTRWHKEGLTHFSPSSHLSPVHDHHYQPHLFVGKSPWQPPVSLSPVDVEGYHSRRSKFKLSST